jgi:hypothetical protein
MDAYRIIYLSICLAALAALAVVFIPAGSPLVAPAVAGLALALLVAAAASLRLLPRLRDQAQPGWLALAIAFVVGGVVLDLYATQRFTPDLALEANAIARGLLAAGLDVAQVKVVGLLMQALLVLVVLALFATFLAQRDPLLREIPRTGAVDFTVRLFGGPGASLGSVLMGKVRPRNFLLAASPMVVGLFLYRWYLGLEWFGLVPYSRIVAPLAVLALSLAGSVCLLRRRHLRLTASPMP